MAHLVKSVKQSDRENYDRRLTEILDDSHIFLLALIISVSMSILKFFFFEQRTENYSKGLSDHINIILKGKVTLLLLMISTSTTSEIIPSL